MKRCIGLLALIIAGCGRSERAPDPGGGAGGTPAGGAGATSTGGGSSFGTGGTSSGSGGSAGTVPQEGGAGGETVVTGDPKCGFERPAFCDTFEQGPKQGGRSGELDPKHWSVLRAAPSLHASLGFAYAIGPAYLPECRAGVTGTYALPDDDTRICEPTSAIGSRHLLAAVAAQNYGLNTYRIRYPFDFTGRVGILRVDMNLSGGGLFGWSAIAISKDPSPAPSYDFPERGSGARNGVQVEFNTGACGQPNGVIPQFFSSREYVETAHELADDCDQPRAMAAPDALNHVELRVSSSGVEVWASDASPDGVTFPNFRRIGAVALDLPFSRGYVSLIARNHATLKYWSGASWATRWDNVGFDGPIIRGGEEISVPEPLGVTTGLPGCELGGSCVFQGKVIQDGLLADGDECVACEAEGEGRTTGWVVPREDEAPVSIEIPGVSAAGATGARLVLAVDYPWFEWNEMLPPPTALGLRYRLNGGAWHERYVTEEEANAFGGEQQGAGLLNQVITLDATELVEGTNVLELTSLGTWTGEYRAAVSGIDMILDGAP